MLTRVGARCREGGGRNLGALWALGLSVACAVDGLDRLGAGHDAIHAPDAGGGPALTGPLRPDGLALDASAAIRSVPPDSAPDPGDAGSGVPSASGELLPNPSFEQGHEGWFGLGSSSIVDVLQAHRGSRAILSTNRAAAWDGPAYDIRALVEPWRAYAVSAWVRNELDTQMVMLTLKYMCDGDSSYARLATRLVATEWLQLTSGFFVPPCPTGLQSLLLYVEGPPAFKNLLVDDVSLQAVTLSGEAEETTDAGALGANDSEEVSSSEEVGGPSAGSLDPTTTSSSSDSDTASTSCSSSSGGRGSSRYDARRSTSCDGD